MADFLRSRFSLTNIAGIAAMAFALGAAPAHAAESKPAKAKTSSSQKKLQKKPQKKSPAAPRPTYSFFMDGHSGAELFSENADVRREPASLTKIMTAMVVFDEIHAKRLDMDQRLPLTSVDPKTRARGPVMLANKSLPPGTLLSVRELLNATIILSAADASLTLAIAAAGSEEAFVALMNAKAQSILRKPGQDARIKIGSTNFANPHGMPHPSQYSTARDMAQMSFYLIRNYPKEYPMFGETSFEIKNQPKPFDGHNQLMVDYVCKNALGIPFRCMDGIKTGFTNNAGSCLAASAAWKGHRPIGVILGDSNKHTRNRNMRAGLDRAFTLMEDMNIPRNAPMPHKWPAWGRAPTVAPEPSDGIAAPAPVAPQGASAPAP